MNTHLRRSLGLVLLLSLGAGCYSAEFTDYEGQDAGPDSRAKVDTRDASRTPDTKARSEPASATGGQGK
jgi:hypothetical protein